MCAIELLLLTALAVSDPTSGLVCLSRMGKPTMALAARADEDVAGVGPALEAPTPAD